MINTTQVTGRRTVEYAALDEFLADATSLAESGCRTLGNWSYGQILHHLAEAMRSSIDGFDFKAAWPIRVFIAPLIKNSVLSRPMRAGFKLPKRADPYLPPEDASVEESLDQARAAVDRLAHEDPRAEHPVFGKLAREEWMALHLRHAELHMSFVVPDDSGTNE